MKEHEEYMTGFVVRQCSGSAEKAIAEFVWGCEVVWFDGDGEHDGFYAPARFTTNPRDDHGP